MHYWSHAASGNGISPIPGQPWGNLVHYSPYYRYGQPTAVNRVERFCGKRAPSAPPGIRQGQDAPSIHEVVPFRGTSPAQSPNLLLTGSVDAVAAPFAYMNSRVAMKEEWKREANRTSPCDVPPAAPTYDHRARSTAAGEAYGPVYHANIAVTTVEKAVYQAKHAWGTGLFDDAERARREMVAKNERFRDPAAHPSWEPEIPVFAAHITACQSSREAVFVVAVCSTTPSPVKRMAQPIAMGRWRLGSQVRAPRSASSAEGRRRPSGYCGAEELFEQSHRHLQLHLLPAWDVYSSSSAGADERERCSMAIAQYISDVITASLTTLSVRGWSCGSYSVASRHAADASLFRGASPHAEPPNATHATFTASAIDPHASALWHLQNAHEPRSRSAVDTQRSGGLVSCYTPLTASVHVKPWTGEFSAVDEACYERPPVFTQKHVSELTLVERESIMQWKVAQWITQAAGFQSRAWEDEVPSPYSTYYVNSSMTMGHLALPARLPPSNRKTTKPADLCRMAFRHELLTRLATLRATLAAASRELRRRNAVLERDQLRGLAKAASERVFGSLTEVCPDNHLVGYIFSTHDLISPTNTPSSPAIVKYLREIESVGQLLVLSSMVTATDSGSQSVERFVKTISDSTPTATLATTLHHLASTVQDGKLGLTWPWACLTDRRHAPPRPPCSAVRAASQWKRGGASVTPASTSTMEDSELYHVVYASVSHESPCTSCATKHLIVMADAANGGVAPFAEADESGAEGDGDVRANDLEIGCVTDAVAAIFSLAITVDAVILRDLNAAAEHNVNCPTSEVLKRRGVFNTLPHSEWVGLLRALCASLFGPPYCEGRMAWRSERVADAQGTLAEFLSGLGYQALSNDMFKAKKVRRRPALDRRRKTPVYA